METLGEFIRAQCSVIVTREALKVRGMDGAKVEELQTRTSEAELASRLRAGFGDIEAFLNAQGGRSERDIVVFDLHTEIEVKYFRTKPGMGAALADWRWLVGLERREPDRRFNRFWVIFFPRAAEGALWPHEHDAHPPAKGEWRFQRCISYTPESSEEFRPFAPFVQLLRRGNLEPKLQFTKSFFHGSILRQNGNRVRVDVIGRPFEYPIWAVVYEVLGPCAELPDAYVEARPHPARKQPATRHGN